MHDSLVFTAYGTYFSTANLTYAGRLSDVSSVQSLSSSAAAQETLVLTSTVTSFYPYVAQYPAAYKRYTGALLAPQADLPLPLINGQQSYGRKIFHSGNGSHVVLVQTGTPNTDGVVSGYFVIAR